MKKLATTVIIQGVYYGITGLWGLLHIESFMKVTGPKFDIWLVKMVSVLIIVISIVLITSGYRKNVTLEIIILAIGSAIGFIAIDVYYVAIDRIDSVYLLDALAEVVLIIVWAVMLGKNKTHLIQHPPKITDSNEGVF